MNKIFLIGNLTADPVINDTNSGKRVCNFSIAVNAGPDTDFFRVSAWNGTAEACAKYLKKGSKVCVDGSIHGRTYQNKEGQEVQYMEIQADRVEFLSSAQNEPEEEPSPAAKAQPVARGYRR